MSDRTDLLISPAPWHYDDSKDEFEGICAVWDANNVFIVGTGDMEDCSYSEIANARLMAAAPELYEALQDLYDDWPGPDTDTLAAARAALAKARGEA